MPGNVISDVRMSLVLPALEAIVACYLEYLGFSLVAVPAI